MNRPDSTPIRPSDGVTLRQIVTVAVVSAVLAFAAFTVATGAPPRIIPGIIMQYPAATPYVDARVLAANVAETVTVPASCDWIIFSSTAAFYLRADGGTAAVPAADVTDGTASALSPSARRFVPATTFSIVAPATTVVTMECYDFPDEG